MKVVVISNSGECLPIVFRLLKENVDVEVYIHSKECRNNYDGIIPKLTAKQLKPAIKKADIVFFDMVRVNQKTKEDAILLRLFGLKQSTPEVFGAVGDSLRKDHKVIGASSFASEYELDRKKGVDLARKMGFEIPVTHEFKSLKEGVKFLKASDRLWVFKPDDNMDLDLTYVEKFKGELAAKMESEYTARIPDHIEYVLQEKIDGTEISTEVWITDKGPRFHNYTIEDKKLMDGNLGPAIGSQSNTVWLATGDDLPTIGPIGRTAGLLHQNGYQGPCDANCIIRDNKPYFLEWTMRCGYDALYCLLTMVKGKLSDFLFSSKADFRDGFATSQRITIPPFPYTIDELRRVFAKDVSILGSLKDYPFFWAEDVYEKNGLRCAGVDGIIGVCTAWGNTIEESCGRMYHNIGKLKICSYLQYRKDHIKEAVKRYSNVQN